MMPDHVPGADFPLPLPAGMEEPPPATARDPGPLHHSFKINPTGGFDRYDYSRTAVAKDWRVPTEKVAWVAERPPNSDHLFAHDSMLSKQPNELLNPPPLTKEEKKAKAETARAEKDRRAGLGDAAREAEDEQTKADKWLEARSLSRRALAVRIGRKAWNYGIAMTTTPSEIATEQLVTINAEITMVLPEDEISLTSDQAVIWLPHAVPLSKETLKWFNKVSSISSYQSVTKDIYELLLVDELEEGRFKDLEVCAHAAGPRRDAHYALARRVTPCSRSSRRAAPRRVRTSREPCVRRVGSRARRGSTSSSRSSLPRPSATAPSRRQRRGAASGSSWRTSRSLRSSCPISSRRS
jgi:hypothetical protein